MRIAVRNRSKQIDWMMIEIELKCIQNQSSWYTNESCMTRQSIGLAYAATNHIRMHWLDGRWMGDRLMKFGIMLISLLYFKLSYFIAYSVNFQCVCDCACAVDARKQRQTNDFERCLQKITKSIKLFMISAFEIVNTAQWCVERDWWVWSNWHALICVKIDRL